MASKIGILNLTTFGPLAATPAALPMKAAEIIYAGCMIAYDPANAQAFSADPSMPATSIVVGFAAETVDNRNGAKGDLTISPQIGIGLIKTDGNLTAAHLFQRVRIVDDHTVGVPAGNNSDRTGPILVNLDGAGGAHVLVSDANLQRAPITVTLASTDGVAAAAADLAALKAEAEKIGDDVRAIHAVLVTHRLIAPAA